MSNMRSQLLGSFCWKRCSNVFRRDVHKSAFLWKGEVDTEVKERVDDLNMVVVRPVDRRLLVWSGKYKSVEDVPNRVSRATIAKCHSTIRVKFSNIFIAVTLVGCILFVSKGKSEVSQGATLESIAQERFGKKSVTEKS